MEANDDRRCELVGTLRTLAASRGGVALGWCVLETGEGKVTAEPVADTFVLELDDGGRVEVRAPQIDALAERLVPEHTERGTWSALRDTALGRLVADKAPGVYERVRLRGAVARSGDRVCVIGAVLERGFGEATGSLRAAPARSPRVVQAHVVAGGSAPARSARRAEERLARLAARKAPRPKPARATAGAPVARAPAGPPRPPPLTRAHWYWLAVALALTLIGGFVGPSPLTPAFAAAVIVVLATAVWFSEWHRAIPPFESESNRIKALWKTAGAWLWVPIVVLAFGSCIASSPGKNTRRPFNTDRYVSLLSPLGALVPAVLLLAVWRVHRRSDRVRAALLDPPRGGDDDDGAWRVVEGRARRAEDHNLTDKSGPAVLVRRNAPSETPTHRQSDIAFTVATETEQVAVETRGAVWSTPHREQYTVGSGKGSYVVVQELIPFDVPVVVAGPYNATSQRIAVRGPGSLVIAAYREHETLLESLAAQRATFRSMLVVLALLAGLGAALCYAVWRRVEVPVFNPAPAPAFGGYSARVYAAANTIDVCALPNAVAVLRDVDDNTAVVFPSGAPFPVTYFSQQYRGPFVVSSNGWMSLDARNRAAMTRGTLGTAGAPTAVLAPLWTDLRTSARGVCYAVLGEAPRRRLVVQWDRVDVYGNDPRSDDMTFQVQIHESRTSRGAIEFVYVSANRWPRAATRGIANAVGEPVFSAPGVPRSPSAVWYTPD